MIECIEGVLAAKTPAVATLQVGGIGFLLRIPVSTYDALPDVGRKVRLLTHFHVREDEFTLYGFATESERELFLMLLGVNQVGPRLALNILSSCSVDSFKHYIVSQDAEALAAAIKGVGKKTASRLIVELLPEIEEPGLEKVLGPHTGASKDAVKALVSLGEKRSVAQQAIRAALQKLGPEADRQALMREAMAR